MGEKGETLPAPPMQEIVEKTQRWWFVSVVYTFLNGENTQDHVLQPLIIKTIDLDG
jgi:hypothetical protein